jgi:hypothetical protein
MSSAAKILDQVRGNLNDHFSRSRESGWGLTDANVTAQQARRLAGLANLDVHDRSYKTRILLL